MKRVRILLRVSSDAQLETDGDLSIQRQLVMDYIAGHSDWELDEYKPEYFEGSASGYKNAVADRDILREVFQDAQKKEFEILAAYKDDRIGRRMWEIGAYIMALKKSGVDIYTVKDGCISPETDDIMGQVLLAIRYGNAQKSSSDTGMRVKDTAQKLAARGKFMGGRAPYGYRLENSGEVSKHGRLLKKLVICPERAEVVRYIYRLSLDLEFGSLKIAKILNENELYRKLAPNLENPIWKSTTVTSILTNPIYTGRVAYKRRERVNGTYRTLDSKDWIVADKANEEIRIIDDDTWNQVQEKRVLRANQYRKKTENDSTAVISRNDGMLPLIDLLHCGYCGCKMANGSSYHYWTIKSTGEKRTRRIPIYKCSRAAQGILHDKTKQFRADKIEPVIFQMLSGYIEQLQKNEDIFQLIEQKQDAEKQKKESELKKEAEKLEKIQNAIAAMNRKIPEAIAGGYALSIEELMSTIRSHEQQKQEQQEKIKQIKKELERASISKEKWEELYPSFPTWREIFLQMDTPRKRVLVNKLVERIDVRKDKITIHVNYPLSKANGLPASSTS